MAPPKENEAEREGSQMGERRATKHERVAPLSWRHGFQLGHILPLYENEMVCGMTISTERSA